MPLSCFVLLLTSCLNVLFIIATLKMNLGEMRNQLTLFAVSCNVIFICLWLDVQSLRYHHKIFLDIYFVSLLLGIGSLFLFYAIEFFGYLKRIKHHQRMTRYGLTLQQSIAMDNVWGINADQRLEKSLNQNFEEHGETPDCVRRWHEECIPRLLNPVESD